MSRTFRVLTSLGGCGGTIASRALAANGALVLSEVNPRSANIFAGALNPLVQMNRDHFTLLPDRRRGIDVHTLGVPSVFGRFMAELADALEPPLVIRDYSYVDYIGLPFVWPRPSSACLREALDPFGSSRAVLFVRHPADCFLSLLGHSPLATALTPSIFVAGHLAFYEDNRDYPLFRFEDFLEAPQATVESMCASLDLTFNPRWADRLGEISPLTGHPKATSIVRQDRKTGTALDMRLREVDGYERLLSLGGYIS